MLKIICGDPEKDKKGLQGATSSFFVLPFRYRLKPHISNKPPELYFTEIDKNKTPEQWVERRRYFTRETASILFDTAHRYRIDEDMWENSNLPSSYLFPAHKNPSEQNIQQFFKIRLSAPEIILFEKTTDSTSKNSCLIKTGFLVVKTYFEEPKNDTEYQPVFADLLLFNERFRYWRARFDEHLQYDMAPFFLFPIFVFYQKYSDIKKREYELMNYPQPIDFKANLKYIDDNYFNLNNLISTFNRLKTNYSDPFDLSLELFFRRWQNVLQLPIRSNNSNSNQYCNFIEADWAGEAEQWFKEEYATDFHISNHSGWVSYSDNRCFVWSNAITEDGLKNLQSFVDDDLITEPEASGHWVKFLNVDEPGNGNDDCKISETTQFEREWCRSRSYKRWAHKNSIYGFNYHSGVLLSPKTFFPLSRNFRRHYFDMILLLLHLRISIFRISGRLSELTRDITYQKIKSEEEKEFLTLRREFAFFTNLYQFPLISNQQQMIEIYQIARNELDIDILFKEVEEEIKSTHEYFSIVNANKLNDKMNKITTWGLVIAILGLLLTAKSFDYWFELFRQLIMFLFYP